MLDVLTLGVIGFEEYVTFFTGNENRNISKCRTPVEKHDGACKTSEKRRHSVDEKRKTSGTDKAESSPRKEPPKNVFRPSHLESTPDPGMEYIKLSC